MPVLVGGSLHAGPRHRCHPAGRLRRHRAGVRGSGAGDDVRPAVDGVGAARACIGPAVSGTIAEEVGWRWVFVAILPLVPLERRARRSGLAAMGPPPVDERARRRGRAGRTDRCSPRAWRSASGSSSAGSGGGRARGAARGRRRGRRRRSAASPAARRGRCGPPPDSPPPSPLGGCRRSRSSVRRRSSRWRCRRSADQRAAVAGLLLTAATLAWTAGAWLQERRGHVVGRDTFVRARVPAPRRRIGGVGGRASSMPCRSPWPVRGGWSPGSGWASRTAGSR